MRWLTNAILALTILAMAAGLVWHRRQIRSQDLRIESVRQALRAIQSEAIYHPAVDQVEAERTGFAKHIDPAWFRQRPRNALLQGTGVECPWIDQPMGSYRNRFNPVYVVADADHAAFWYNPARGVVRARVPRQLSQQGTIDLYNRVNGTALHPDEVAWNSDRKTAWVDAGPPEAVVTRDAPNPTAPSAGSSHAAPSAAPGNRSSSSGGSGGASRSEPTDPVLRDFGGGR